MRAPNPFLNHPTLQILQQCKTIDTLKQVHAHMITTGLIHHTYPVNRILLLSSTLATLSYALTIFNQVPSPTTFLFNTIISSLAAHAGREDHNTPVIFSLYNRILIDKTLRPNNYTYPSLFKACGSKPWFQYGRALHGHVLKFLEPPHDLFVQASLLNFYSKRGEVGVSRYLFDQIDQPDLASWNSILSAYARNSTLLYIDRGTYSIDTCLSLEVLNLFSDMQKTLIKPNEITLVSVISSCADLAALSQGMWAHAYVIKNNLNFNLFVGTALISMYGNSGCLQLAYQLFDQLPQRDVSCYNAMIRGFAIHGLGREAVGLFKKMRHQGLIPDDVTMVVTMTACSHVGLVDEGCKYFESMKEYGLEPKLEHYGCLVDLLGRAGRLKEAEERVRAMPMKPNSILWRSLLGAARIHGSLGIGEIALENLMELEPETSGNYVLLSNMYARINRWDDAKEVRKLMKDHGVNKMPGISLVEINGAIHEFTTGDKTHPESKVIFLKLEEMSRRLQEYGHMPRTGEVLFDIEDEEKGDALLYHSERLAIAFALVVASSASSSSVPIRIIKNLRVCGDCHASTKIISKVYEREIVVRDRTRFHHFKNGTCSCKDYW